MSQPTLDAIADRLTRLEQQVVAMAQHRVIFPRRDWQSVVGISEMTEFSRQALAASAAIRERDDETDSDHRDQ